MITRGATDQDITQIVMLIQEYSVTLDVGCAEVALDLNAASLIVKGAISQGLCMIALSSSSNEPVGVCMGVLKPNMWSKTVLELEAICFYVKPEHRSTTAGGRLISKYMNTCKEMMSENDNILGSWVSLQTQTNLTDRTMIKHGYKLCETKYLLEK